MLSTDEVVQLLNQRRHELQIPLSEIARRAGLLIHPFENGNGRWARLLANVWLKQNGQGIVARPDEHLVGRESSIREEYIAALKTADSGNLDPLIEMHKKYQLAGSPPQA
jgi:fido (protein-threonine AMPylation protein)